MNQRGEQQSSFPHASIVPWAPRGVEVRVPLIYRNLTVRNRVRVPRAELRYRLRDRLAIDALGSQNSSFKPNWIKRGLLENSCSGWLKIGVPGVTKLRAAAPV